MNELSIVQGRTLE